MSTLTKLCRDFIKDEEGLTILEYVIGAALIITVFVIAGGGIWGDLKTELDSQIDKVEAL